MANIFERASRKKLRFATAKGQATTEDLWQLSLTDLNTLAQGVNKKLREVEEESFLSTKNSTAASTDDRLRLDLIKHVIGVKEEEATRRAEATEREAQKQTLRTLLETKKAEKLTSLSEEELEKRLAALEA